MIELFKETHHFIKKDTIFNIHLLMNIRVYFPERKKKHLHLNTHFHEKTSPFINLKISHI